MLLAGATLQAQQIPAATELPGKPFLIKHTWIIGGEGSWDYMALDPVALQLFVAHGPVVQVVDVNSGTVAGQITGLREAHAIALDDSGEVGYISDGPAAQVKVFDRRTFKVVASIPAAPNPRALTFDPQTRLLFVVSADTQRATPPRPGNTRPPINPEIRSTITVIDAQSQTVLASILLPGRLGFAQIGGGGHLYINVVDRNQIARLDVQAIVSGLHDPQTKSESVLDWSAAPSSGGRFSVLALGPDCRQPSGLAIDAAHQRLFVACGNMRMVVLNPSTGEQVASLPIGPGADAIGYDPGRGLIYTANGGAQGSLTVVSQDVTDTYSEIQNVPTRQRARTLAVNPVTGEVYLVTDVVGVKLDQPGGIGALKTAPMSGSFQVLVIGN
jgi:DNA-binding beta-propeller fold protein YncE